jgi:sRNA-binding carbon storage regulator CsrA
MPPIPSSAGVPVAGTRTGRQFLGICGLTPPELTSLFYVHRLAGSFCLLLTQDAEEIQEVIMLVLTRRVGESVLIFPSEGLPPDTPISAVFADGPIQLTLTRINGSQARIGIVAPQNLTIAREEVV